MWIFVEVGDLFHKGTVFGNKVIFMKILSTDSLMVKKNLNNEKLT